MKRFALLLATCLVGCPSRPPAPVHPPFDADASPSYSDAAITDSEVLAACANLRTLGCLAGGGTRVPDGGRAVSCEEVVLRMKTDNLTALALACVSGAGTRDAAQACAPTWRNACRE